MEDDDNSLNSLYTKIISRNTLNADHYLNNIFKENASTQYANHDSWYKKNNDHKMLFLSNRNECKVELLGDWAGSPRQWRVVVALTRVK